MHLQHGRSGHGKTFIYFYWILWAYFTSVCLISWFASFSLLFRFRAGKERQRRFGNVTSYKTVNCTIDVIVITYMYTDYLM
ncbi:hypothetical protein BDZ91DRAFT_715485 [Kalaharituber pfeilii]|nr:hypothetical protein BDZ91DRAFT_715485 [Kalaharituber pfeilii]